MFQFIKKYLNNNCLFWNHKWKYIGKGLVYYERLIGQPRSGYVRYYRCMVSNCKAVRHDYERI